MTSKEDQLTYRLVFGALFIVVPISLALIVASAKLGPASIPIWISVAGCVWLISKGAIGDAIAARLRGDVGSAELQAEALTELDDLRTQMAELQERVDFTERLLAQEREARPLGPGTRT
jgi:hypothetical protein